MFQPCIWLLIACFGIAPTAFSDEAPRVETYTLDRDPEWEGYRNRCCPIHCRSRARILVIARLNMPAAQAQGEIGGHVQRSSDVRLPMRWRSQAAHSTKRLSASAGWPCRLPAAAAAS